MAVANSSFVVETPPQGHGRSSVRQALAAAQAILNSGDLPRAEMAYGQVVLNHPTSGEAWFFLGVVNQLQKKIAASVDLYRQAIRLAPQLSEAWNNLGVSLQSQGEVDEALGCHLEALRLEPDYPEAHNNVGNALQALGRLDEAVLSYQRALHFRPDYFEAKHHMGNALGAQGRMDEAIACYDEVIRKAPDYHKVRLCRAMAWLQGGDYPRGWAEYEWRLKIKEQSIPPLSQPLWDGGPLEGRSLLILAEQGLGDSLQFVRYATLAAEAGGRVTVACRKPLERVLEGCRGVERVICEDDPIPDFDCYAPLLSLPRICGTTLETVPADVPYLAIDRELQARLGRRAGLDRGVQGRRRLAGQSRAQQGPAEVVPAGSARAPGQDPRRASREPPERGGKRTAPRARGELPRDRPGASPGRPGRHRGGRPRPRPRDLAGHLARPPRGGPRSPGLARTAPRGRLALAHRPRRQPVVSDNAAVPATAMGRLE